MKVDRQIVVGAPQAPREADVGDHPGDAASPRRDQDLVEMRIAGDDGCGGRFDQVGEMRVRILPAQGGDGRGREHHIANLPQAHEEDTVESASR